MRDEIRANLQNYQSLFGADAFLAPAQFTKKLLAQYPDTVIEFAPMMIIVAIGGMDAYSRLVNSTSRNRATDVDNLTREMHKQYHVNRATARVVIESIAELLGYTPVIDSEEISPSLVSGIGANYSKSEPLRDSNFGLLAHATGDILIFGDYEWRVLDKQEDKLLLISEHILEQRAYHPCYSGTTWENSALREYLNDEFLRQFTQEDIRKIIETKISNPDNLWYSTPGGNDTFDKIFVLSMEEVDRYFGDSEDYLNMRRKKYAKGEWVAEDKGWILANEYDNSRVAKHNGTNTFWWLRTPGYSDCTVAYVSTTGNIAVNGDRICIFRGGMRPALWVRAEVI